MIFRFQRYTPGFDGIESENITDGPMESRSSSFLMYLPYFEISYACGLYATIFCQFLESMQVELLIGSRMNPDEHFSQEEPE